MLHHIVSFILSILFSHFQHQFHVLDASCSNRLIQGVGYHILPHADVFIDAAKHDCIEFNLLIFCQLPAFVMAIVSHILAASFALVAA
jgi:hypothetical protein